MVVERQTPNVVLHILRILAARTLGIVGRSYLTYLAQSIVRQSALFCICDRFVSDLIIRHKVVCSNLLSKHTSLHHCSRLTAFLESMVCPPIFDYIIVYAGPY